MAHQHVIPLFDTMYPIANVCSFPILSNGIQQDAQVRTNDIGSHGQEPGASTVSFWYHAACRQERSSTSARACGEDAPFTSSLAHVMSQTTWFYVSYSLGYVTSTRVHTMQWTIEPNKRQSLSCEHTSQRMNGHQTWSTEGRIVARTRVDGQGRRCAVRCKEENMEA